MKKQLTPSILRRGEIVGGRDHAEEIAGEPFSLHAGGHQGHTADGQQFGRREPVTPTFERDVSAKECEEGNEHREGEVGMIGAGGMHDQAGVGRPEIGPHREEKADDESALGQRRNHEKKGTTDHTEHTEKLKIEVGAGYETPRQIASHGGRSGRRSEQEGVVIHRKIVLILDGPYIENGHLRITEKPGLGVDLNPVVVVEAHPAERDLAVHADCRRMPLASHRLPRSPCLT